MQRDGSEDSLEDEASGGLAEYGVGNNCLVAAPGDALVVCYGFRRPVPVPDTGKLQDISASVVKDRTGASNFDDLQLFRGRPPYRLCIARSP